MGLQFYKGDITKVEADAIVNAANAKAWMGGFLGRIFRLHGVAESIHYETRGKVEKEAKLQVQLMNPSPGEVYVTSASTLPAKWILHAVTMPSPGMCSNLSIIEKCLDSIILQAQKLQVESIAIPALGTGTGKVPLNDVAWLYIHKLFRLSHLEIIIADPSGNFLNILERDLDVIKKVIKIEYKYRKREGA